MPYLAKDGVIVTSNKPFINIPNYPEEQALFDELNALPNKVVMLDIEAVAKDAVVGAVVGVGAIAVGVGITQTENMLFHNRITSFPSSAGSSIQRLPSRHRCAAARRR